MRILRLKEIKLTSLHSTIFSKVGKMPANMSIFHAGGIYRQILVNAGKYWKLAFTILEVRQNPTLSINLWTMSVIGAT